jgi:hypothetical protein
MTHPEQEPGGGSEGERGEDRAAEVDPDPPATEAPPRPRLRVVGPPSDDGAPAVDAAAPAPRAPRAPGEAAPVSTATAYRRQGRRRTFLALGAGVAIALLAVAGFFVYRWQRGSALPMALGKLPGGSMVVVRAAWRPHVAAALGLGVDELPEQAIWSAAAAELCGGDDVFTRAMMIDSVADAEDLGLALRKPDGHADALACGKEAATGLAADASVYEVGFDAEKSHFVTLWPLGRDGDLPLSDGVVQTESADELTHASCMLGGPCRKSSLSRAKLEHERYWLTGSLEDVMGFAYDYGSEGKNQGEKGELLEEVAVRLREFPIAVASLRPSARPEIPALPLVAGLSTLAGRESRSRGSPYGRAAIGILDTRVRENQWAVPDSERVDKSGVTAWGMGIDANLTGGKVRIEIHCNNKVDAQEVANRVTKEVADLKRDIKEAELAERTGNDAKKPDAEKPAGDNDWEGEGAAVGEDFWKTQRAMAHRGIKNAEVGRDLSVVWIEYTYALESRDERAIEALRKRSRKRAKHAAAIVDRLLAGERPEDADLEAIGGAPILAALAQPATLDVPGLEGVKVPGGAKYRSNEDEGVTSHSYSYLVADAADVSKSVRESAEAAGWKARCKEDEPTPDCELVKTPLVLALVVSPAGRGVELALMVRKEAPPPPEEAEADEVADGDHHGVPGVEGLDIPGPCRHRGFDHGEGKSDHTYSFRDSSAKDVRKKLKAAARAGGWKMTKSDYDDYAFELHKDGAKVGASIRETGDGADLAITVW